ncbi:MAG: hypothetical protein PUP92_37550 [Rhizonema sp. PD38]|nr:hypothetical protein [Rhizonema sp. PD38]
MPTQLKVMIVADRSKNRVDCLSTESSILWLAVVLSVERDLPMRDRAS